MARHATITATGLPVYFARPHSPWERGSNENLNRIVREYFPKGETITSDPKYLAMVASDINDRPRKTRNWRKPSELFTELVETYASAGRICPSSSGASTPVRGPRDRRRVERLPGAARACSDWRSYLIASGLDLAEKPQWRKSRRSADQGNCVEVAFLDDGNVAVRDSKDAGAGAALVFTPGEWTAFVGVVDGEFERP